MNSQTKNQVKQILVSVMQAARQWSEWLLDVVGINLRYTLEEAGELGNYGLVYDFVSLVELLRRIRDGLYSLSYKDPLFDLAVERLGGHRNMSVCIVLADALT